MAQPGNSTSYETEMNQPGHRPGMQGVSDRTSGATQPPSSDPRNADGTRTGARRVAGDGDPAARKRLIDAALSSSGGTAGSQSAPTAPSAAVTAPSAGTPSYAGPGGLARERAIMSEVDQAAK